MLEKAKWYWAVGKEILHSQVGMEFLWVAGVLVPLVFWRLLQNKKRKDRQALPWQPVMIAAVKAGAIGGVLGICWAYGVWMFAIILDPGLLNGILGGALLISGAALVGVIYGVVLAGLLLACQLAGDKTAP